MDDRQKILIVDDSSENLSTLYHALHNDYEVFGATCGKDALMVAKSEHPDLILLDIMMPEMDGYEVCTILHGDADTQDIPVIFITARRDVKSEMQAFSAGGVDFIQKPFHIDGVRARVALHLELMQRRRHLEATVHTRTCELSEARIMAETANLAKIALVENMMEGFAYCRMIYDDAENPVDFVYIETNHAFERLTGVHDAAGKTATEIFPGIRELHPDLFEIYGRVARTGRPEKFEIEFKPLPIRLLISVYSNEKYHFVAVFDNITERRQMEESLRKSETTLRQLTESIREVFFSRTSGAFLYVNPIYADVWGQSCESLYADPDSFFQPIHPSDRDRVRQSLVTSAEHKTPLSDKFRVLHTDGTHRWIHMRLFPIDGDGQPCIIAGLAEDVTLEKEIEDRLRIERDTAFRLGETMNMMTSLDILLNGCLQVEGMDVGGVYLIDSQTGGIHLVVHRGLSSETVSLALDFGSDSSEAQFVALGKTLIWPPHSEGMAETSMILIREGIRSLISLPLKSGNDIIGALQIASRTRDVIPEWILSLCDSLAQKAAGIISRIQLNEKLLIQKEEIQNANIALKVLLKRTERDRSEMESVIVHNLNELVMPSLSQLSKVCNTERQKLYVNIVESHLQQITSSFTKDITSDTRLTPSEIRIAEFIRQGKSTKDMSDILGISENAVQFHRKSIRRKLGIHKQHINLQSYLKVLSKR